MTNSTDIEPMASKVPPPKVLQRFGRLRVIIPLGRFKGHRAALCLCDCGTLTGVELCRLYKGVKQSCGCLKSTVAASNGKKAVKHGMSRSKTYHSWSSMLSRGRGLCNPKDAAFYEGVSVCPEWDPQQGGSFEQFLADMGERPIGKTLDRYPDCEGDYCPENCRWATPAEQAENRRSTIWLTYRGETLSLASWGRRLGIGGSTMRYRYRAGWTAEQIIELGIDYHNRVS